MKNKITYLFLLCVFTLFQICTFGQSVAINNDGSAPNASALLDVKSTTKGMLVPRMNSSQRTNIATPAQGLLVYDTDTNSFWFYNAISWVNLSVAAPNGWSLTGNANTDTANNFVGTTDAADLVFRVNNLQRMRLTQKGYLNLKSDSSNTVIGDSAGASLTSGAQNHFIGYKAGKSNTTGSTNHFEGLAAGALNYPRLKGEGFEEVG